MKMSSNVQGDRDVVHEKRQERDGDASMESSNNED